MRVLRVVPLLLAVLLLPPLCARTAEDGETLFRHAKEAWRSRIEAPYVKYGVRTSYEEAGRVSDAWFEVTYRASDGSIAVTRILLPGDEARLRGFELSIFGLVIFDTNPSAEVQAVLRDPAIDPGFTFGMMPRSYRSPATAASDDPTPNPEIPGELREIGRVIAINREYRVTLAGIDSLRYGDAYHLVMTPLRDPVHERLRDLWVATDTYALMQLRVAGILDVRPYDSANWTVTYVPIGGRMYIQQVRTEDPLRFGQRKVQHFQLDFVDYKFPSHLPPRTFERW
jgi:hypothetical protein